MVLKNHTKKLKELTRGKRVDEKAMREFIEKLDIQLMKKHVYNNLPLPPTSVQPLS